LQNQSKDKGKKQMKNVYIKTFCCLLALMPCVPQNTSASASSAITCLAIGGGLGVATFGFIHPETAKSWKGFTGAETCATIMGAEKTHIPEQLKSALNAYFKWQPKKIFAKKQTIPTGWISAMKEKVESTVDTVVNPQENMSRLITLGALEGLCIFTALCFLLHVPSAIAHA